MPGGVRGGSVLVTAVLWTLTRWQSQGRGVWRLRSAPRVGGDQINCASCEHCGGSALGYPIHVLRGLEYLRTAGVEPDDRVAEAIGVVEGNRDPDGRWPLQDVHAGDAHFQMEEGEGTPSRWNTLRAMRVLHWFAQGG
jgi:hypothetical protein